MILRTALCLVVASCLMSLGCSSSDSGSVDQTQFSAPCNAGECANGGVCADFSEVDKSLDSPFCVDVNPCSLVSCNKSGTCSVEPGKPQIVQCH
jgi:hypothetical protein